jgi:hypothetical protein
MLVYRDSSSSAQPTREWLQQLVWRAKNQGCALEEARELCVEFGELEAAIVDDVCVKADGCSPLTRALRRTGVLLGAAFLEAFERNMQRAEHASVRAHHALESLLHLDLPIQVYAKVPEGFAYYALYPEQYLRAAQRAFRHCQPQRAIVLGLRSIGTTLSSVVEACLQRLACHATSYVVRPRGEPFARTVAWEPALQAELQAKTDAHFFVVDEGPGLSGSSFSCVALALRQLGIERSRIVFLPSYSCDGSHFVNDTAKRVWQEHVHFVGSFELAWLDRIAQGAELRDLSSGAWRRELGAKAENIACHPQHERRKYLALAPEGGSMILRFAGFGSQGRRVLARAKALEPSGVTPHVLDFADGMLALEHIPAKISAAPPVCAGFADKLGEYLAFRRARLAVAAVTGLDVLAEMTQRNIAEALGSSGNGLVAELARRAGASDGSASITDGRLLPHEWLASPAGIKKVDAFDHGDDHFYPGPCDVAWDLAGALTELGLDASGRQSLLDRYASAAGDPRVADRLPFFELAYLAYRVGYVTMAARALTTSSDEAQFRQLARRYRRALRDRLKELER